MPNKSGSPAARVARRALLRAGLAGLVLMLPAEPARAADDDIVFTATVTADDQSIPTESPGIGQAEVRLERATLKITWNVTYRGLTSAAVSAGLYGPENVGANAGRIVDLAVNGLKSPLRGSKLLSDGEFQYLITGRVYVNIHTRKYPDGELRGQLRRRR